MKGLLRYRLRNTTPTKALLYAAFQDDLNCVISLSGLLGSLLLYRCQFVIYTSAACSKMNDVNSPSIVLLFVFFFCTFCTEW